MTYKDLNAYYLLEGAIRDLDEEILRLEASLVSSPKFDTSGIPKNPTPVNRTEKIYIDLIGSRDKLFIKREQLKRQKDSVEQYIEQITDFLTQRVFQKRVFEKKRFRDIAKELGGGNTEEGIRQLFNRYLKKH